MKSEETERYTRSCLSDFWQEIFRMETEYLSEHLSGCMDILSVGCGPAHIENQS